MDFRFSKETSRIYRPDVEILDHATEEEQMNFQIERLKRLPQQKYETWQGKAFRMPNWVENEDTGKPYRPWSVGWLSLKTRAFSADESGSRARADHETILGRLAEFACDAELAGYRPAKVQVADRSLAEYLSGMLEEADIEVETREKLFLFDEMLEQMIEETSDHVVVPAALDSKGVTVEMMRSFADAADVFYRRAPWDMLSGGDLIEIEEPAVDNELRWVVVLGSGGDTMGLGFHGSRDELDIVFETGDIESFAQEPRWFVVFCPVVSLPLSDADLWEDEKLPVAGDDAYPLPIRFSANGKSRRPKPDVLAFFEGLLRTLATTSEDEADQGRWSKTVDTAAGPQRFTLSLPGLLEPDTDESTRRLDRSPFAVNPLATDRLMSQVQSSLAEQDFDSIEDATAFVNERLAGTSFDDIEPETDLDRANDLVYKAYDASGRKQLQLAKEALAICPDCADAYTLLGDRTSAPEKAVDHYRKGIQAAENVLGEEMFREEVGHFWGITSTRPYMRARLGLAQCLEVLGNLEEATEHYRDLLRLNPNDNQGIKDVLLPCLVRLGLDREARTLVKKYKDTHSATWLYGRALLEFRKEGDTVKARKHLEKALEANEFVPDYLLGHEIIPVPLPQSYSLGSEEEGVLCANWFLDAWEETDGATEWLDSVVATW